MKKVKVSVSPMDNESQISGSSLGKRSGSTASGSRGSSNKKKHLEHMEVQSDTDTETDVTDITHVTILPHNKVSNFSLNITLRSKLNRTFLVSILRDIFYV